MFQRDSDQKTSPESEAPWLETATLEAAREQRCEELLALRGWHMLQYRIWDCSQEITLVSWSEHALNTHRLTPREFELARLAALGLPSKEAASSLSISWSTARTTLSLALGKLGLHSSVQLPGLWHVLTSHCRSSNQQGCAEVLNFHSLIARHTPKARLTDAEWDVLRGVLAGRSNREIAALRRTSVRTVANQLATLFAKFGASTRNELAAKALGLESQVSPTRV